jgi:aminoglycoside 6-adenylyltransferase
MRSESEMMALIVHTAQDDDRIRAVMLNGSRVNPRASRDIFQDFDVIYFVTELGSFKNDHRWLERFGELMILQMPEAMGDPPPLNDGHFAYLMQFTDGNRIDLTLFPVARLADFRPESLSVLLLDKDQLFEALPPPSEHDHLPQPPTANAFADCCNEFWWVAPYVAKGLWRDEIVYAKYLLDHTLREQLMKMLTWQVGIATQFTAGPGKFGRHLQRYLAPERWARLVRTYSDAGSEQTWEALHTMCALFRTVALEVAEHFRFEYPEREDELVRAHLKHVQALPRDATDIY